MSHLFRGLLLPEVTGSASLTFLILGILLCAVIGYLLGGLNFATIISKNVYHDDIREHGSKNAGSTNMMRTFGNKAAFLTLGGDVLKGVVSVVIGGLLMGVTFGMYAAALGCMLGHVFPVYFGFRGGKGVATAAGAILVLDWRVFLCVIGVFLVTVLLSRYISLGSVLAAAAFPMFNFYGLIDVLGHLGDVEKNAVSVTGFGFAFICSFLMAVLVIAKHYENLKRLANGKESKFSFKKSKK